MERNTFPGFSLWACLAGLALAVHVLASDDSDKESAEDAATIPAINTHSMKKTEKKPQEKRHATPPPKAPSPPPVTEEVEQEQPLPPVEGGEEEQEIEEKADGGKILNRPLDPV